MVELNVFIAQLSELNRLQYNWRIFSSYPLSRIFTTNPDETQHITRIIYDYDKTTISQFSTKL